MIGVRKMHLGQIGGLVDMAINVLKKSKTEIEKLQRMLKFGKLLKQHLMKLKKMEMRLFVN